MRFYLLSFLFACLSASIALTPASHAASICPAGNALATPTADFTIPGNGTVTHSKTGLMWKQCAEGQSGAGCVTGSATAMSWGDAINAAATTFAGYSDWRLPNKKELRSIVETGCYSPSINETAFPATPISHFWSSTTYASNPANAWDVYFYGGGSFAVSKANNYSVRLVRGGQSFDSFDAQSDTTPDAFSITAQTSADLSSVATSNTITVSGINIASAISIVGGTYSIDGGAYTATAGTVSNSQTVAVRQTASASYSTLTTATLTIGGVTGDFNVTTLAVPIVNGACDSTNHNQTLTAAPAANLCTAGTASAVTSGTTSYDWNCAGSGDGISTSCNATRNYIVTSISGANGSISGNQTVAYNATPTFTLSPSAGYTASAGGTCGGTLAGNSYTTSAVTASCTVVASFSLTPIISYTAPAATGTGNITASFTGGGAGCGYSVNQYIPLSGHAASPPAGTSPTGVTFPHGLFDFITSGCTAGSTISMTITYPTALPAGTVYWKYGPTPTDASYHWYQLPSTISGNTAAFSITDGGLGDDDLVANGTIVDQGGPGVPPPAGGAAAIPTLSEWGMILLAGLMGLFGWRSGRGGRAA
jgi:hypothetical protein